MSSIQAVISDFGGVLTSPLVGAFAAVGQHAGLALDDLGHAMAHASARHGENPLFALERGELGERAFLSLLEDGLAQRLGRRVRLHDFSERFFAALEPNTRFVTYLQELRGRGLRLALLTNNVREWEPRWRTMIPVDELFEVVVDSPSVGVRKPERAIYEHTLERLDLPAQACLLVDDTKANCAAAQSLEIHAVVFTNTDQAIADMEALLSGA